MSSNPPAEYPHRMAVIDLGSNSAKMVCYSADHTGGYRPYHRESFRVRLDEHDHHVIREAPIARLLDVLRLFQNTIQYEGVSRVLAVATSAVRGAKNREDIISRIRDETGIPFSVLSGREEALYSYTGAATHLNMPTSVFFDIGGGSVEIAAVRNHTVLYAESFPLGALVLTRRFAGEGDLRGDAIGHMREYVRDILPSPGDLGPLGDAVLVGVGGSLRAISRYAQSYMGYPIKKIHNYTMDARLVQNVTTEILSQDVSTLARMYEIGSGRADIIKAGAIVVECMMERFGFDHIRVSSTGLREGVLAFAVRYPEFEPHEISYYMVRELVRSPSWTPRIPHAAAGVVQAVCSSGLLSGGEDTILRAAAANLEWLRTFRDADDFLYRMLDNTSALSHREQLLYALCLSHAKKPKRTRLLMRRYESLLYPDDRRLIRRLSPILLLCDTAVTAGASIHVTLGNDRVLLDVKENGRPLPGAIFRQRCRRVGEALGVARVQLLTTPSMV
ncbi:MAG: hypothetical protein J4G04_03575 [Nitrosopumilaceae archaeon]|nr:hypothetical protein [Nitrosopumilaceae archaeon]